MQRRREKWTMEEHELFIQGIEQYGRNWESVEQVVGSKTRKQIRSHAQKYFEKLKKEGGVFPPPRAKKRSQNPYPKHTSSSTTLNTMTTTTASMSCSSAAAAASSSTTSSAAEMGVESSAKETNAPPVVKEESGAAKNTYSTLMNESFLDDHFLTSPEYVKPSDPGLSLNQSRVNILGLFSFFNQLMMPSIATTTRGSTIHHHHHQTGQPSFNNIANKYD